MSELTPSCGSSETTRKAPSFSTEDFYAHGQAPHVPRVPEAFLQWFVGFFEGDGSLSFSQVTDTNMRLRFTICQKEKTIITLLATTFGFGNITYFKKGDSIYWRWSLDSKSSLERIAFLLSGNLILPKRQVQFLNWIEVGEQKGMFQLPFVKKKPWTATVALDNAWLSGFIDAEGCFYAYCRNRNSNNEIKKRNLSLEQTMTLTQRNLGGEKFIFETILLLFQSNGKVHIAQKPPKYESTSIYVTIRLNSLKSQHLIVNYLFKYKLRTIKYISFHRWWRVYLYRTKGIHQSEKSFKKIRRLVKAINVHTKKSYE
jgi:hypothetical protein